MLIDKNKYSEYYNVSIIINSGFNEEDFTSQIEEIIQNYKNTGIINHVVIDNNLVLQDNAAEYFAAKKLGLVVVPGLRRYEPITDFPARMSIELTNRCNSACKMCPRTVMTREQHDMDFNLFTKLIDEINEHGTNSLYLYRLGESMLHPQFPEMLEYLKARPKISPTWLSTNGILLTDENIDMLLNSCITILNLSVNALDGKKYAQINKKGDYNSLITNIMKLIKRKKELGVRTPFLRGQIIEQADITCDYQDFLNQWGQHFDILHFGFLEEFAGQLPQNRAKNREPIETPCQRMVKNDKLHIYNNGDVVMCICDINATSLKVGNAWSNSIKEIWDSEQKQAVDLMHKSGKDKDHPLCGDCWDRVL